MNELRFTPDQWHAGEEPPEGKTPLETLLGIVLVNVEGYSERDRHDNRYGRQKAGKRRDRIFMLKSGKPSSNKEVVLNTKFVVSREVRLPLPDKRRGDSGFAFAE